MEINNFKELEKLALSKFDESRSNKVHKNINRTMGVVQFIGSMVDLFITKFIGSGLNSLSGSSSKSKYQNQ